MKAQLRLAGDRRKLGRNGLTSDIPRECVDPPEYLRDLRDLRKRESRFGCSAPKRERRPRRLLAANYAPRAALRLERSSNVIVCLLAVFRQSPALLRR